MRIIRRHATQPVDILDHAMAHILGQHTELDYIDFATLVEQVCGPFGSKDPATLGALQVLNDRMLRLFGL